MKISLKKLLYPLIFLVLLATAHAQEEKEAAEPGTGNAETVESQRETGEDPKKGADESAEPFVPTETISEDLSVPFPVDI